MNLPLESLPVTLDSTSVRAALPAYRDFLAGRRALLPVSPDAAGDSPLRHTAREVVDRLHAQNRHQFLRSIWPLIREMVKAKFGTGNWDSTQTDSGKEMLADKMVALDP